MRDPEPLKQRRCYCLNELALYFSGRAKARASLHEKTAAIFDRRFLMLCVQPYSPGAVFISVICCGVRFKAF
jgi:hypothetical protein